MEGALCRPLVDEEVGFFRANGFLRLRRFFSAETTDRLRREVLDNLSAAYRMPDLPLTEATGHEGFYLPLMRDTAPLSRALVADRDLLDLGERLLGGPVVPKPPKGIRYRDATRWHDDAADPHLRAVKIVCYLEPLTAGTGALRVLPGSHHPEFSAALRRYKAGLAPVPASDEQREDDRWPGVVLDTEPGDVVVFDVHLWHASLFGRDRNQWSLSYAAADPGSPEQVAAVRSYIASFLAAGHPYDTEEFPYYDPDWLSPRRPGFASRMSDLGLFDG
ncbi:phytanoyl-CoA dioxygenase family protein [Streptomyces sp. NPDC047072]|uniref:phytanoyl-CoA dioxygenase family protein n=1 Tax=Streptomyces sp. NPDC047072 TaxID=3154809 RepID=UPI0033F3630E